LVVIVKEAIKTQGRSCEKNEWNMFSQVPLEGNTLRDTKERESLN
jgi:hypothetical protein